MTKQIITALIGVLTFNLSAAEPPEYASLKAEAEKSYAEGSYAKTAEPCARAMEMLNLRSNEARWVFIHNADTQGRSQAATQTADTTKLDQVRETRRVKARDQIWAETQESLGDYFWTRRNQRNWGAAWRHYQQALDWWAGARDIELARVPPAGCMKFKARYGVDALKFVNSPMGKQLHLRGVNAKVVQRGIIRVGDVARKL